MQKRTGSIDPQRNGTFRVRATLRGRRRTIGIYLARDEAEQMRDATVAVASEDYADDAMTVADWVDKWLTARELAKVIADPEVDRSRFEHHIKGDPIATVALARLRRSHVLAWAKRVRAKVARQTTLNVLTVLRGALGAAVDEERLRSNVASDVKVRREKRTIEPWTVADADEQAGLVEAAGELERHVVAFAIGTGLRAGELVTLRLADVHLEGATPHVVVRYGKAPARPTKGGKIREVPLFGIALDAAKAWLDILPTFCKRNKRALMFPGCRGGFRSEEHVFRWSRWKKMLSDVGIERRFRWHDLRHTCGSALISGRWGRMWALTEVQAMLGHASITTTERYAHFAGTALTKAASETSNSSGRQVAADSSEPPQNRLISLLSSDFLNRWSEIRILSGALDKNQAISHFEIFASGHMAATCRKFLEAVAVGDSESATFQADSLVDALAETRIVETAALIRARDPLAMVRAVELAESILLLATEVADRKVGA